MRYLVWDDHNDKLIGLIALGDPVFNMKSRDEFVGWNSEDRRERLVNVLDAYVLGALPPYNQLLAGKLVACLVRSREVVGDFKKRYGSSRGIISQRAKRARLVMVTTSSALGRSSVYNRLKLDGQTYFESRGMTGGWGHFHVPDKLFRDLRDYLRASEHPYADGHRFGQGPNWRLRTIRAALDQMGFASDILRHGIQREFFVCELANNSLEVLSGKDRTPDYGNLLAVDEIGELAKDRWIVPRSNRQDGHKNWDREQIADLLDSRSYQLTLFPNGRSAAK